MRHLKQRSLAAFTATVLLAAVALTGPSVSFAVPAAGRADLALSGFGAWFGSVVAFGEPSAVDSEDHTPPTTAVHSYPASNSAGWNSTPVSVTLEATDGPDGSGVTDTRYALDGIAHSYTTTVTVSSEGTSVLDFASEDASGNVEATKSATFQIDRTLPELSLDATASYASSATVSAVASDTLSGVERVELRLDSGPWIVGASMFTSVLGAHTLYARAFDRAGNVAEASAAFYVEPPTTDSRFDSIMRSALSVARTRRAATESRTRAGRFWYLTSGNKWTTSGPNGWACGYVPGQLWASYALTGDPWFRAHAGSRQAPIGEVRLNSRSTDIGIRHLFSFAQGYRLTGKSAYKSAALRAAKREAARFNRKVGAVESRNNPRRYQVIIDQLINVEILYWAADNGGPAAWRSIAKQHMRTTARDFIRPDGSVYHIVNYDRKTGRVLSREAGQGYSTSSMWSRGQAWAVHGFTTAYRRTKDPGMLTVSRRVADRYIAELPADFVPYWDFRAPDIPNALRDSSAAAVAASALLDLATLDPDPANRKRYESVARSTLLSLASPNYLSAGLNPAILLHGTQYYRTPKTRDRGQSFGDYFFLEAMMRLRALPAEGTALPVRGVRASVGKPGAAVDGKLATSWTATGKQWIELDLGAATTVRSVGLAVRSGRTRSAPFKIYRSSDRRHWRLAARVVSGGETASVETYTLRPVSARYVRVECSGTSRGRALGIAEVAVR